MSTTLPRTREMEIAGWGNTPRQKATVYRPERVSELAAIVAKAPTGPLIARGLGRSYGDASLNDNGQVVLDTRLTRFLDFNPETSVLECEAGVTFEDILTSFVPRGYFLPVVPGTKFVTVGGAIAADIHGKNHHHDGSIGEFILGFDLLLASGEILKCSPRENADAFYATLGGMGLTGIILQAKIQLQKIESAFIAAEYRKAANVDAMLAAFADRDDQFHYSVAWIDCLAGGADLGRSVLIRGNHAKPSELPHAHQRHPLQLPHKHKKNVPFNLPGFVLSPLTVRLFNNHYYKKHDDGRTIVDYDDFFFPLDSVHNWNRIYGKHGFYQYQAVFPADNNSRCVRELLEKLSTSGKASFLAVFKAMGKASGGLLSFPRPGQTLALDIRNAGPATADLLRQLDTIVIRNGGRVYLAKDACMTRQACASMYPELAKFNAIKAKLDPTNRFSSSLSRRLGIGGAA